MDDGYYIALGGMWGMGLVMDRSRKAEDKVMNCPLCNEPFAPIDRIAKLALALDQVAFWTPSVAGELQHKEKTIELLESLLEWNA